MKRKGSFECCIECENRKPACWAECEAYAEARKAYDARKAAILAGKKEDQAVNDITFRRLKKKLN